jgi:hypothetical protein
VDIHGIQMELGRGDEYGGQRRRGAVTDGLGQGVAEEHSDQRSWDSIRRWWMQGFY